MTAGSWGERALGLALRLYLVFSLLYPSAFLREYGREMEQVFTDECVRVLRLEGIRGLGRLCLTVLIDLVFCASQERLTEFRISDHRQQRYLYVGALLVAVVTGYVHLRADADALVAVLLLSSAFLCGLVRPTGVWRYAVLSALGMPIALLLAHGTAPGALPHRDADLPMPVSLLPALFGAYSGAIMHHCALRLRQVFRAA